jgi:signal transduction histidine kinase
LFSLLAFGVIASSEPTPSDMRNKGFFIMTLELNSATHRVPGGHTFVQAAETRQKNFIFDARGCLANHLEADWEDDPTENSMFTQSIRQTTLREERTRIAQELHDTLLQTLLRASMQLGVALDSLSSDWPLKSPLYRVLQVMEHGIQESRDMIEGLRLSDSCAFDLVQALSQVPQEIAVQPEIDFRFIVSGREQLLRPPIGHEVCRIGREALLNAFRHSRAKCVELELEYTDKHLRMCVRDNGCGIDSRVLHTGRQAHWGLAGMRERATRIGGLLKIYSRATNGTEVQLSVPGGIAFPCRRIDHSR